VRSKTSNTLNKEVNSYIQKHHPKGRKKKGPREGLEYPTCDATCTRGKKKEKKKKTPFQGEKLPENFLFWVRVSKSKRQHRVGRRERKKRRKKNKASKREL